MLAKIGDGAFGDVYKVRDISNDQFRAMKIIYKNRIDLGANEGVDKFNGEISILSTLDHPNIVKMYEYFEDDDNFYLITEFC
jgi:calcium-dependent protein kinase